jgi:hypothetical protein
MLKLLQAELPKLWTDELYSEQFKASPSKYKDFQHALLHVRKAEGRLSEMVEEADHDGVPRSFPIDDVEKYIADLVICTVRLALTYPGGAIDLEKAVLGRIERKMGVRLMGERERCAKIADDLSLSAGNDAAGGMAHVIAETIRGFR